MQIEEVTAGVATDDTIVRYYTAVLYLDWEVMTSGPSGDNKAAVLAELQLYHGVEAVTLIAAHIPKALRVQ